MNSIIFSHGGKTCRIGLLHGILFAEHDSDVLAKSVLRPFEFNGVTVSPDNAEEFYDALIQKFDPNAEHSPKNGQFVSRGGGGAGAGVKDAPASDKKASATPKSKSKAKPKSVGEIRRQRIRDRIRAELAAKEAKEKKPEAKVEAKVEAKPEKSPEKPQVKSPAKDAAPATKAPDKVDPGKSDPKSDPKSDSKEESKPTSKTPTLLPPPAAASAPGKDLSKLLDDQSTKERFNKIIHNQGEMKYWNSKSDADLNAIREKAGTDAQGNLGALIANHVLASRETVKAVANEAKRISDHMDSVANHYDKTGSSANKTTDKAAPDGSPTSDQKQAAREQSIREIKALALQGSNRNASGAHPDRAKAYNAMIGLFRTHPDHFDLEKAKSDFKSIAEELNGRSPEEKLKNQFQHEHGMLDAMEDIIRGVEAYRGGARYKGATQALIDHELMARAKGHTYGQDLRSHVDSVDPKKSHPLDGGKMPSNSSDYKHIVGEDAGINQAFIVKMDNGAVGVYKPDSGQDAFWATAYGDSNVSLAGHEKAASVLNDSLGFQIVPHVAIKMGMYEGKSQVGSVMEFVPNSKTAGKDKESTTKTPIEDRMQMHLLDLIGGNMDRHSNNWMVNPEGKAFAIDNGAMFAPNSYLRGREKVGLATPAEDLPKEVDKRHVEAIEKFISNQSEIESKMKGLITSAQAYEMFQRAKFLLATIKAGKFKELSGNVASFQNGLLRWERSGEI